MENPFVAEIRIFPFNFAPKGWAWCDGQLLPLSQNTALFSFLVRLTAVTVSRTSRCLICRAARRCTPVRDQDFRFMTGRDRRLGNRDASGVRNSGALASMSARFHLDDLRTSERRRETVARFARCVI